MARKGKLGIKRVKDDIERPVRYKKYEFLFLVVCEDQNTEPTYFRNIAVSFPEDTIYIRSIGAGADPKGVAERAILEKSKLKEESGKEVDFVWIVFDTDDANSNTTKFERFKEAFEIARVHNFKVAWSNEVFELWLLLHLVDIPDNPAMNRNEVYDVLEYQIKQHKPYAEFTYTHGDSVVLQIVSQIGDENKAIIRATNLELAHGNRTPINANPCTKVHQLIKELRVWITYYSYDPEAE